MKRARREHKRCNLRAVSVKTGTQSLLFDVALEGGGTKGIALNAAIAELMTRGHRINRLVGTSAGAIAAALIAAGYTGDELVAMSLARTEDDRPLFAEYIEEPLVVDDSESWLGELQFFALRFSQDAVARAASLRAMLSFLDRGGFVSGEGFVLWLSRQLERKSAGFASITLGALYEATGVHLTVIATDLTSRRLRALNHRTAPRCPVVMAVRMSMSIPLFFAEVVWSKEWGTYLGEDLSDHVMVDGGVLSNLPIAFILPTANVLMGRLMGPNPRPEARPIGLAIDTSLPVAGAAAVDESRSFAGVISRTRLGQRISALSETITRGMDLTLVDLAAERVCCLPAKGYHATEFDMSSDRARALLESARGAMGAFLDDIERGGEGDAR